MPTQIAVLDGITLNPGDNPWTPIEAHGEVTVYDATSPAQIIQRCAGAAVVLTNKVVLTAATLKQLPDLRLIAVTATGYNVVDVAAANELGIAVCNVPVYSTQAVAQHVFAMILAMIHRVQSHHDAIAAGQWQKSQQFSFWLTPIEELSGKTLGVVGFGRIGQSTARLAQAFGMNLLIHSRTQKDIHGFESARWGTVQDVFSQSDYISLHCPLTETNAAFVNAELISQMQPHAVLINTARGGLIDETALADALNNHRIGGACLDVLSSEPPSDDNPLLAAERCLLTPHVAWTAIEARSRLMQITADNILAFLNGNPINIITP
jgi:glycerate dehydrogenase